MSTRYLADGRKFTAAINNLENGLYMRVWYITHVIFVKPKIGSLFLTWKVRSGSVELGTPRDQSGGLFVPQRTKKHPRAGTWFDYHPGLLRPTTTAAIA
jgi:hypothetical protein